MGKCIFVTVVSSPRDRRGRIDVTDKGRRRQKLENREPLYFGIRWARYVTFDFKSKSQKKWWRLEATRCRDETWGIKPELRRSLLQRLLLLSALSVSVTHGV